MHRTNTSTARPHVAPEPTLKSDAEPAPAAGRFAGKVALVTGGSDRGIGGAIAERLAREGAGIALFSRHEPKRLLKRLDRLAHGVVYTEGDIRHTADVQKAVAACLEEFGQIDVLVNNAGVEFAKPFEKFTDDEWQSVLDINLHGAIRVTRAALPHLAEPGGAIVNVASALGLGGCPSFTIYSASKAALIGWTQSLAWELAPKKQRVVGVAPALVATPMTFKHLEHLTPKAQAQIETAHPLGVGSPHDVAAAVAFLASDEARWITGVTLPLGWAPQYALPVDAFMADGGAPS